MSAREDFTEHVMPSGAVVFYREGDHSYWPSIKPKSKKPDAEWSGCRPQLTGISTVSAPFDFQPDNLMRWAAKTNGVGIAQLVADTIAGLDPQLLSYDVATAFAWCDNERTIWQALEEAELTYADLKDRRAEEGTNVHKHALHALASGKPVPDYHELTEQEHGYAQGVADFWLAHMPEPLQAEQVVCSLELGVAGRLDLRCKLGALCGRPSCPCRFLIPNRHAALIDAKTSGYIPNKHHVQVAGYEWCAKVSGIGASQAQWILQVDEDGGWELVPVRATADHFKTAVAAYRGAAEIGKAAEADRKLRREGVAA